LTYLCDCEVLSPFACSLYSSEMTRLLFHIFFRVFVSFKERERKKSWDILLSFFVIAAIHKLHKNLATAFLQQRNEKIKQKKYLKANILMYIYDNQTIHILLLIWIWVQHRKKNRIQNCLMNMWVKKGFSIQILVVFI
jgi:hypothetical protein